MNCRKGDIMRLLASGFCVACIVAYGPEAAQAIAQIVVEIKEWLL